MHHLLQKIIVEKLYYLVREIKVPTEMKSVGPNVEPKNAIPPGNRLNSKYTEYRPPNNGILMVRDKWESHKTINTSRI